MCNAQARFPHERNDPRMAWRLLIRQGLQGKRSQPRDRKSRYNRRGEVMIAKMVLLLMALSIGSATLTACNTVQGAGKDVEKAGQKVQEEAVEHKKY
jgi:predicted small secreted protein